MRKLYKLNKRLKRLIRYLWQKDILNSLITLSLAYLTFKLPLYYDNSLNNIYGISKATSFRYIGLIIFILLILRSNLGRYKLSPTPLALPILFLLVTAFLSTISAISKYTSLFGCYGRYESFSTLFIYIILFYAATLQDKSWQKGLILTAGVISGILASLAAIFQKLAIDLKTAEELGISLIYKGLEFMKLTPNFLLSYGTTPVSTFGNQNFLAAYLVIIFPILCLFIFQRVNIGGNLPKRLLFFFLYLICILLSLIGVGIIFAALLFTGTRGAWVAFLALIFTIFIFTFIFGKKTISYYNLALFSIVLISVGLAIFRHPTLSPLPRIASTIQISPKKEKEEVSKKAEAAEIKGVKVVGSAAARLFLYKQIIQMIKDYPALGVGLDNMKFIYPCYSTPALWSIEGRHAVYDKAHNDFLEVCVTRGIIGLLVYLWLILAYIFFLFHKLNKLRESKDLFYLFSFSALVGFLVQNLFNFSLLPYHFIIWIIMGIGYADSSPKIIISRKIPKLLIIVNILFLLILFITLRDLINRPILADKHFAYARAAQTNLDTKEIINQFQLAHNIYPYEEYYYRFSVSEFSKYLPKEEAIEHIKKAILLNPVSSSYYDSLGSLYTELNRDKEAEIAFKKAYKLNPNNIEALINLGFLYYKSGKNEEAIRIYSKGLSLAPYTESEGATLVANLLESYQNKGEIKKAIMLTEDILSKEKISLIKERSSWDKVRHILAKLYFKEGNYTKSYRIMEKLVKLYPENMQYFCDLGSAYYKAGDFKKAKLAFQYVVRKDPANSYAQKVLATLK